MKSKAIASVTTIPSAALNPELVKFRVENARTRALEIVSMLSVMQKRLSVAEELDEQEITDLSASLRLAIREIEGVSEDMELVHLPAYRQPTENERAAMAASDAA